MNLRIAAIGGLAGVLLAAGCSSGSSGGGSSLGSSSSPSPVSSHPHPKSLQPSATTTVTGSPTPTVTVTAPVSLSRCLSSQLSLSLGSAQGAAGSTYTPIVFTNHGSGRCELRGYPGVSFVDASGARLGKPAKQATGKSKTIKLASGGTAHATLQQGNPGNYPPSACRQVTADRLKVYPPGETQPLYVKDRIPICTTKQARTLVSPVAFGSSG